VQQEIWEPQAGSQFHGKSLMYRYKMANVRALEPSFKTRGLLDILEAA